MIEFRILGPLEVSNAGGPVRLGGPKQRALLALLVIRGGEVVTTDRLIDELSPERSTADGGQDRADVRLPAAPCDRRWRADDARPWIPA